jgi:hypothetical protein
VGVITHVPRGFNEEFQRSTERGASPLPGLTWRHKIRIAGKFNLFLTFFFRLYKIGWLTYNKIGIR